MSKGERGLVAVCVAVAVAAALAGAAALAVAIVRSHEDRTRIRSLEQKISVLCARQTVSHVRLTERGRVRVSTARGC